jgi:hypothetical protein
LNNWEAKQDSRVYGSAEYLLWWFKDSPLPVPLLATTSNPGAAPVVLLGDPSTTVLLGDQRLNTGLHQGARFTIGGWIDDHREIAVEGSYFFTASKTTVRTVTSGGQPDAPVLAVPFFDEDAGGESSILVAAPGNFAGSATLSLTSRIQGAELLGAVTTCEGNDFHFQVLAGFRYLNMTEHLSYATASTGLVDPNTDLILNTLDQFNTQNLFYGCQLGARADYRLGNFDVSACVKLALGDMIETATINGAITTNFFNGPPGGPYTGVPVQNLPGAGIFAQPSNVGRVGRDQIAFIPEIGVKIGYQITEALRIYAGYDLLYVSSVIRPGDQIDRGINFSQTVQSVIAGNPAATGTRPAATLTASDFWMQGIQLGLEVRY